MHILLTILGIMGAAAVWWYRFKYLREAAGAMADAVASVRYSIRRNQAKKKAAIAPVTVIHDPLTAAATLIFAIAAEDWVVTPELENHVREVLSTVAGEDTIDKAVIYGKWASEQVAEVPTVIDHAGTFLASRLCDAEKKQLLEWIGDVATRVGRHVMFTNRLVRLRARLGLAAD